MSEPSLARRATSQAAGAALFLGLAAGTACAIAGALTPDPLGLQLVVLGLMTPGLLLQDTWRFIFVATGHPRRAACNDAVWAVVQAVGFTLLLVRGGSTAVGLIAVWGVAGCVAAAFGCLQSGLRPGAAGAAAWLLDQHRLGLWFAVQSLVIRGAVQLMFVAVAAFAGLGTVGAVRGAQVLFSPLTLLYQGILLVAVPEGVRVLRSSPRSFRRMTGVVALASTACAVAWSLVVLALPNPVGRQLMGATWDAARPLAPIIAAQTVSIALSMGPQVGLRAVGAARRSLGTDILQAAALLVAGSVGAVVARGVGTAAGIAGATALATVVWWVALATAAPGEAGGNSTDGAAT